MAGGRCVEMAGLARSGLTMTDLPKLAPIPRRARPLEPTRPVPSLFSYLIEVRGEPARVVHLDARLAAVMERLMSAGPLGIVNQGDPRLKSLIWQLRKAGVPLPTSGVPTAGDGTTSVARYVFDADVISVEKLPATAGSLR
jgi:hypothetical protein